MRLEPATAADLPSIAALLESLKLPTSDLGGAHQRFLVARQGQELAGCVALEGAGEAVLLRSLAVAPAHQRHGLGTTLHAQALALARASGATELFLLTTTAEGFFARHGYHRVDRSAAPAPLQASAEFASLCPATAVCMARRLG
jgi:N-acetylglutamate synthase-like GNAT family acetyltransferase